MFSWKENKAQSLRLVETLFNNDKFIDTCRRIETSSNFLPRFFDLELKNVLSADEKSDTFIIFRRSKLISKDRIYDAKITKSGISSDGVYWKMGQCFYMVVSVEGDCKFFKKRKDTEMLGEELKKYTLDGLLGIKCSYQSVEAWLAGRLQAKL